METFIVYEQKYPTQVSKDNYKANLQEVAKIQAHTGSEALTIAKEKKLARFPVIGGKSLDAMRERSKTPRWEN